MVGFVLISIIQDQFIEQNDIFSEESHCFDSYKNNSILGTFITAISVMIASYSGCNRNLSVVFFVVALAFMGVYFPQIKINPLDLSRNFAGSLMAFSNGIGALAGFISPIFAGFMTPKVNILQNI